MAEDKTTPADQLYKIAGAETTPSGQLYLIAGAENTPSGQLYIIYIYFLVPSPPPLSGPFCWSAALG